MASNFFDLSTEDQIKILDKEIAQFDENTTSTQVGASQVGRTDTKQAFEDGAGQDKSNAQRAGVFDSNSKKAAARAESARKEFTPKAKAPNLSSQSLFTL